MPAAATLSVKKPISLTPVRPSLLVASFRAEFVAIDTRPPDEAREREKTEAAKIPLVLIKPVLAITATSLPTDVPLVIISLAVELGIGTVVVLVMVRVEVTVSVMVSVTTMVIVDTEVDGMLVLAVSTMAEVEVAAGAVTVCVVSTAEMHEQADEYCSRVGHWEAIGNRTEVDGTADSEDATEAVVDGLEAHRPRFLLLAGTVTVAPALAVTTVVSSTSLVVVTTSVTVEVSAVKKTMMSVHARVVVSVAKTTSAVGVLGTIVRTQAHLDSAERVPNSTYTVVTAGDPNMDTQAAYWTTGLLSREPATCCRQGVTVHSGP